MSCGSCGTVSVTSFSPQSTAHTIGPLFFSAFLGSNQGNRPGPSSSSQPINLQQLHQRCTCRVICGWCLPTYRTLWG